jgi:hypothetical protein
VLRLPEEPITNAFDESRRSLLEEQGDGERSRRRIRDLVIQTAA